MTDRPLLVVRDDASTRALAPFATLRPLGALPVGVCPIAERWGRLFPNHEVRLLGLADRAGVSDAGAAPLAPETLPAGSIVAESRAVVALDADPSASSSAWRIDERVAAVRIDRALATASIGDQPLAALTTASPTSAASLRGHWITRAWDLLSLTELLLPEDLALRCAGSDRVGVGTAQVLGDFPVRIAPSARLEPFVVIDATRGAVWIDADVTVQSFTRLTGPLYVGPGTQVFGGRIGASVIGPQCRVAGELTGSILAGYVNKGHDGFVGHSVLAPWVNLGAGTTTSNLKNSYGTVRVWTPEGMVDTGRQFIGALLGDHVKLGIGTMLSTGSVIGAGANVFGSERPPVYVPPFAWGDVPPYASVQREQFLVVASRVMARRAQAPTSEQLRALGLAYDAAVAGAA